MNWREFGRKLSWPNFNVLSQNFHAETEENKEKPQSIAGLQFEI
jgi:hypothetical protein